MAGPKLVLALVSALLLLIFIVQNTEVVGVNLLFWKFEMSRVILILLTAAMGFVCGYLIATIRAERSRRSEDRPPW